MPHLPADHLVLDKRLRCRIAFSRTLWLNAALCVCLAFYYADHFRIYSIWRFSPFLFLLPAIWGVRQGMRTLRINLGPACLLAASMAVLMLAAWTSNALWIFNWLLLGPALYLLATSRRSRSH